MTTTNSITISDLLNASDYLNSIYERHIKKEHPDIHYTHEETLKNMQNCVAAITDIDFEVLSNELELKLLLRHQKACFSFFWAIANFHQLLPYEELGKIYSDFAQRCIQQALSSALIIHKAIDQSCADRSLPGFFILALGKLGGNDLNFSSDVDIIAFYNPNLLPSSIRSSAQHLTSKYLKTMSLILTESIQGEFVWRVDWRLRPNASSSYLSQSIYIAEDFYFFHAQPWHRLALVKARVIAGDIDKGHEFLKTIYNFIWRKNLDYRDIDEISRLKTKINLEHPTLKMQRQKDDISIIPGFNVKLGHGGIREIEFIVNALQLLWGGKKSCLQESNTLANLHHIARLGLLDSNAVALLISSYIFLRTTENAIQILGNQQTYHIPTSSNKQNQLLKLLSLSRDDLFKKTTIIRQHVSQQFNDFFNVADNPSLSNHEYIQFELLSHHELTDKNIAIINGWFEGFHLYGVTRFQTTQLKPLAPLFIEKITSCDIEINSGIEHLHAYLASLPVGGQYLRLLLEKPSLLDSLISPLLISESMNILLKQSPHIIEQFCESSFPSSNNTINLDQAFVTHTSHYEERLERLRRVTNENLYFIYLCYLNDEITHTHLEDKLSELAFKLLSLTFNLVKEEMQLDHVPIAIISFGKLAIKAMGPRSDIDLFFIFDDKENQETANRFVSRFNSAINARMREGIVYELDNRLRPYGNSGSLCISIDSLNNYHMHRAKTWEHLALTSSRFITGDERIGEQFLAIKHDILKRCRSKQHFYRDCYDMLSRIRVERITYKKGIFSAKLISGGLMELEYIINVLFLYNLSENPSWIEHDYNTKVKLLSQKYSSWIDDLNQTLQFLRKLQVNVRFYGSENTHLLDLPQWIQSRLCLEFTVLSIEELAQSVNFHCTQTLTLIDHFFEYIDIEDKTDWALLPVVWD
jgi:[glutamine synthetase] adenylyltransferase / [glutamine synthetase]-adenylyl-L-tyrosine phosphorylase